ncbi:MAG: hypothetical protein DMG81_17230, partial [Acidobacteria bacterium]
MIQKLNSPRTLLFKIFFANLAPRIAYFAVNMSSPNSAMTPKLNSPRTLRLSSAHFAVQDFR